MHHPECLPPILAFLADIGIVVRMENVAAMSFLPGVAIVDGTLSVDTATLEWPGDVLHEAGHIAVLPSSLRHRASEDLSKHIEAEFSGELEAMAWAYAATVELDLPLEVLIHEGGYGGRPQALIHMYSFGIYPGLLGLCKSGMAAAPRFMENCGPIQYPKMLRWLRC